MRGRSRLSAQQQYTDSLREGRLWTRAADLIEPGQCALEVCKAEEVIAMSGCLVRRGKVATQPIYVRHRRGVVVLPGVQITLAGFKSDPVGGDANRVRGGCHNCSQQEDRDNCCMPVHMIPVVCTVAAGATVRCCAPLPGAP